MATRPAPHGALRASVLQTLHRLGSANAREVLEALPNADRTSYASVQITLTRLVETNLARAERHGNRVRYHALQPDPARLVQEIDALLDDAHADAATRAQVIRALNDRHDQTSTNR